MATAMARLSSTLIAFLVACLGIALFCVMDTLMKGLVIGLGVYNAILWRSMLGSGLSAALFVTTRTRWPAPALIRLHLQRGAVIAVMALLWFWSLEFLPLAEAVALSFIAPLIALFLAAVLLKERIGGAAIIASGFGLAGVLVMIGARIGAQERDIDGLWGAAAVFGSAVLYAYNLILARRQALLAKPPEIALFMNGTMTILFGLAAPWLAVVPDAAYWPAILAGAALALISLLLLSWAYARAEAQILIPVEYTAFVWLAILGWAVFDEVLTWPVITGTVLIITGSLIAARASAGASAPATTVATSS
jgi:S-adenosylmethionine uptake transporter